MMQETDGYIRPRAFFLFLFFFFACFFGLIPEIKEAEVYSNRRGVFYFHILFYSNLSNICFHFKKRLVLTLFSKLSINLKVRSLWVRSKCSSKSNGTLELLM